MCGIELTAGTDLVRVRVAVVMVVVGTYGFESWWCGAAVGGLATGGLELDGCVSDVETVAEGVVDAFEDCSAVGHRYVGDSDVAGEGVRAGAEGPDV